jgi:hypothetical protein
MPAALLLALMTPALAAADAWEDVVAKAASRDEAVAALGKPEIEFTAFIPKGDQPLQISPSLPPPPMPGEAMDFSEGRVLSDGAAPEYELVRVLEYPGIKRGLAWQVVLKDEKVWYAVAPPMEDERDLGLLAKKLGKAPIEAIDVLIADTIRTWDLIRYPKKKRIFVREPGAQPIVARIILR